ncbi:tRNA lysidine(34) synthetase TilS [Roseibium algicola]|uniref:tRNA(Ile)-lysidine synthase n=1 Tax=Roseibium algicola TaxID=2857014 RepID=A0ABM6I3K3_9HYPH|nr:tRNA lysidine(34) synthetase TilS [Roseibium aggregatum]
MNAVVPSAPDGPVEPLRLPADRVDALFSKLSSFSNLALAVSGGSDSLCLLVLFDEWRKRTGWQGAAEVLCVDHQLRPESGQEAEFVATNARACGLACTVLRWTGTKPAANLQEAARIARYRLMAARMRDIGAEALVLGHHLDDQAETFLDRLTRGSGVTGLSGMAADEDCGPEGLRLLRPLLSVSKSDLEATLEERGRSWCTDPSNRNPKYKRSRLRAILSLLAEEGLSAERLAQTATNIRRAREALERTADDLVARLITEHPAGPARLEREAYREQPEELRLRLLVYLMARVSGKNSRPRLARLQALDGVLMSGETNRQTFQGSVFDADASVIRVWKEPGREPPGILTGLAGSGSWDGRYLYRVSTCPVGESDAPLCLGPLMNAPVASREIDWPAGWPKAAFDCAPVLWRAGEILTPASATAVLTIGNTCSSADLNLERMPIQGKLPDNFMDNEDTDEEI